MHAYSLIRIRNVTYFIYAAGYCGPLHHVFRRNHQLSMKPHIFPFFYGLHMKRSGSPGKREVPPRWWRHLTFFFLSVFLFLVILPYYSCLEHRSATECVKRAGGSCTVIINLRSHLWQLVLSLCIPGCPRK